MGLFIIAVSVSILLFGSAVVFGAPYLPTLGKQAEDALDLLDLEKGQLMLELGSGDGKVLVAAAKRGICSVGYEINPVLVIWSKLRTWKYRDITSVKWGNYWQSEWPESDGMYVFLLQKYMKKLDKKLIQYQGKKTPYKLVSNSFVMSDRRPEKTLTGLSLYIYNK